MIVGNRPFGRPELACDRCRRAPRPGDPERDLLLKRCKGCGEGHELCRRCVGELGLAGRWRGRSRPRWPACPDALEVARAVMGDG